jgi:hypothetical protein
MNSWCGTQLLRKLVPAMLVASLVGQSAPSVAARATAYGQQFVRSGQVWSDAGPTALPDPPAGDHSRADETQRIEYQKQVSEIEVSAGPYTDALAEPLAALALHYRESGDMDQAERLYRRALHIVRVNDGLYSERQIPILRELLNTYRIAGDLETLDERYEYFFRLYGRGQPPYTDIRLRAALEYLRWQREALRLELDGKEDAGRLLSLYELNEELLQGVAQDPAVDPSVYRNLGLSQLRNLYLIQDMIARETEQVSGATRAPLPGYDWSEQELGQYRLETIQRGALSRGATLMEVLLAREGAVPGEQTARLHLELADWYQWNGRDGQAAGHYDEVERLLAGSGMEDTLRVWLGQPVELPDNGAFWQPVLPGEDQRRVVVRASYDVSERGRASNIQTRTELEEDSGIASRLRRKLSRTRFRPRYSNGKAQSVAGLVRNYELID